MNTTTRNLKAGTVATAAAWLVIGAAFALPAHAGGFYGPRNTIPVDPMPPVEQACGAVFAPTWTGPRLLGSVKVKDLGRCPTRTIGRWVGPRATIPVYEE